MNCFLFVFVFLIIVSLFNGLEHINKHCKCFKSYFSSVINGLNVIKITLKTNTKCKVKLQQIIKIMVSKKAKAQ